MNLLIPLRNTSQNNYYELRHSIRSICLHNTIERCLVIGDKPSWYIGEHLPHVDYPAIKKEENIRDKVIAGSIILNNFLFANDDHFLLSPYQGVHDKGLISESLKNRNANGSYTRLLKNTFELYGNVPNVDTHCPMLMDADGVKKTLFDWPTWGVGFKTTYAQANNIESTYHLDTKLYDLSNIPDVPYFSTYEGCKNLQLLSGLFQNKSIFER